MKIIANKIASVCKNINLKKEVEIDKKNIICRQGYILAVEVLTNKKIYNQIELTSGRLSTLRKGDKVIVALGDRRALKGFVGVVPKKLKAGDIINILNLGGVCGRVTSENVKEVGHSLKIKILGAVVDKNKKPIHIDQYKIFETAKQIISKIPLIIVSGTCMEVGKTCAAGEIIKSATKKKYKVLSAKVAGVAAQKDTIYMQEYGSNIALSIIDAGYTSTVNIPKKSVGIAKGAINYLSKFHPDFIVLELGDGILGQYGVMDILKDREIQQHLYAHIGCASDPPAAFKLHEICQQIGAPLNLISGPVTDNSVGKNFIKKHLKIMTFNGITEGYKIFQYLQKNNKKSIRLTT